MHVKCWESIKSRRRSLHIICCFFANCLLLSSSTEMKIQSCTTMPLIEDTNHNGSTSSNGCLTDGKYNNDSSLFLTNKTSEAKAGHSCWTTRWDKTCTANPLIQLTLSRDLGLSHSYGLVIKSYINENENISKIKEIECFDVKEKITGYVCEPVYEQNDIYINLDFLRGNVLTLRFDYASLRIVIRQLIVTQIDERNRKHLWNQLTPDGRCSKGGKRQRPTKMTALTTTTKPTPTSEWSKSEVELSDDTIFVIRLSASLSVIGVFFIFTIVWCCLKKNNIIVEIPIRSKKYFDEGECLTGSGENLNNEKRSDERSNGSDFAITNMNAINDPCICQVCLSMDNNSSYLIENRNNISPRGDNNLDDRRFFVDYATNARKFDSVSDDSSPIESPQHRYLDLPASVEEDGSGLSTNNNNDDINRKLLTKTLNVDNKRESSCNDIVLELKNKTPVENENNEDDNTVETSVTIQ